MIVEAFASFLVSKLRERAMALAQDNIPLILGVDHDLLKLENDLEMIQDVLQAAEKQQLEKPSLRQWLREVKMFAYEAEDVLDEFATKVAVNPTLVDGNFLNHFNVMFHIFRFDMARKIKKVHAMLEGIVSRKKELNLVGLSPRSLHRCVGSLREREAHMQQRGFKMIGRDNEKKNIIAQLVGTNVTNFGDEPIVKIVPIVGMGGVGKTTLAQSIFNEKIVVEHFTYRKWVFVGEKFNAKEVIGTIIQDNKDLSTMQNKLLEEVKGRKFLIVLDDVWDIDEKISEWEELWIPLTHGEKGGRVIVTCRSHKIVQAIGNHDPYKPLARLDDNHCWSIFEKYAFVNGNSENSPDLKSIGWEIVHDKLKGIPLAAQMVGRSLLGKPKQVWESIQQDQGWFLRKEGDDMMDALRWSFRLLPCHLKSCFSYCAIYPKGWKIEIKDLILKWMAIGAIHSEVTHQRLEDVGESYFKDLLQRSFFQEMDGEYVMHDLIHDLAQLVSVDECKSICNDEDIASWSETVLHVSVASRQEFENLRRKKIGKLRTFGYAFRGNWYSLMIECFPHSSHVTMLKCLRVLDLKRIVIKTLSESVGALIHLRYLSLQFHGDVNLPESMCDLHNLQTLIVESYLPIAINSPRNLSKLTNLRHLNVGLQIMEKIRDLRLLTSLQELQHFKVQSESGHRISELSKMNQLRGRLHIWDLKNIENPREAAEANLKNKVHLRELALDWSIVQESSEGDSDFVVLEGLQPHQNLENLEIWFYYGARCPSWLSRKGLTQLRSLKLHSCENIVSFVVPDNLLDLKLSRCKNLRSFVDPELLLPILKRLEIEDCPLLQVEDQIDEVSPMLMFPSLEQLEIDKSSLLMSIIQRCRASALQRLRIAECLDDNMSFFKSEKVQWDDFVSLEHLKITNCENLTFLPDEILLFPSLRKLDIWFCVQLLSFPKKGLPKTLESISIWDCDELKVRCQIGGPEWPKVSNIRHRDIE